MDNLQGGYLIVSLEDDNIFEEITEIVSRETKPLLIKGIEDYDTKDCFISVTDIIATKDENDEVLYYTLPVSGLYKNDSYCIKMAYVYPTVYTVKENRIEAEKTIININNSTAIEDIKTAIENKDPEIIITGDNIEDTEVNTSEIKVTEDTTTKETEVEIPYNSVIKDGLIVKQYISITNNETKIENKSYKLDVNQPLGYDKNGFLYIDNLSYYEPYNVQNKYDPCVVNLANGFRKDDKNYFTYLDCDRIAQIGYKGTRHKNVLGPTSIFKILNNTDKVTLKSENHFYYLFPFESVSYKITGDKTSKIMNMKHYNGIEPITEETSYELLSSLSKISYYGFYQESPYYATLTDKYIPIYVIKNVDLIKHFDKNFKAVAITYTIDSNSKTVYIPIRMYGFDKGINTLDSKYYSAGFTWNETISEIEPTIANVTTRLIDLSPAIEVGSDYTITKSFDDLDNTILFYFNELPNVVNFSVNNVKYKMYNDSNIKIINGCGYYTTISYKLDLYTSTDIALEVNIKRLF